MRDVLLAVVVWRFLFGDVWRCQGQCSADIVVRGATIIVLRFYQT